MIPSLSSLRPRGDAVKKTKKEAAAVVVVVVPVVVPSCLRYRLGRECRRQTNFSLNGLPPSSIKLIQQI
ncbi:hypothetical protein NL676_026553 [Syzygium grande]|nr:hypothetical protein NL676_026553 [Syzygium grande]